ncbi:MAG: TIGR00269 family protein [Candidatus Methanomethylicia archaeon]|nr:TIGR00269 family protein [Candidatus Methanomethylicia archaeon]MCX8169239.1 TIGR00269 family protein [Candidatus Methanomethylicia archaeon]MDW7988979.1 TIGR00269 family protein [Nitrososphaerota archaeon]
MKCSKCNKSASYFKKISGVAYCKSCFIKYIEDTVRWTINKKKLFDWDDHILLAVSGGKDSVVMLKIVSKIEREFPNVKLTAVTIDEGVENYREEGIEIAREISKECKVDHLTFSFKEFYGYTLTEIIEKAQKIRAPYHACTYCGVLRRKILNIKGKELGTTKIATAHNLDDETQTILMNILRGDINKLIRSFKMETLKQEGFIPRVKPMKYVPEREIALYAYYTEVKFHSRECPFSRSSLRNEIRSFLNDYETHRGEAKYAIVSSFEELISKIEIENLKFKICKHCGEPTTRDICRACELLEELKIT